MHSDRGMTRCGQASGPAIPQTASQAPQAPEVLAAEPAPCRLHRGEADRQRRDALLWNFTVLGEAAGRLSDEIKARFPDVTWQQPVRLRDRIVHGYWSIDLDVLHTTASEQLPGFTIELRGVLRMLQNKV
jgi:uncharacterized protein with HEPN domain